MTQKRLLVLGASYSQSPLIEAAKRMGVYTITCSIPGPYPGFELADEAVYENIADPAAVTEAARRVRADGIATCGLDLGMRAIGQACETLSLPGPSAAAARRASDKWEMKQALASAGVQTARFFCIHNEEELLAALAQLPMPVILKAVDQMGSRGIYRCDTKEEVLENYPKTLSFTQKDYCLLEEFIVGELFGVEGMIQDGRIVYLLPNNTEAFMAATPTPVGHSIPYRYLDTLGDQILTQAEKAIRAIGLDNCPVNLDMIRRDDRVYVIELTGRSGATGLSEMVGLYYDLDYYEMIVRCALGMPVSSYFQSGTGRAVLTHTLMADRDGVLKRLVVDEIWLPGVEELSFNVKEGDEVHRYRNGRDRIGQLILTGETLSACEEKLDRILQGIRLEV